MANGKATDAQFGELHELTAEYLITTIRAASAGRLVVKDEGEYVAMNLPPALLAQAIKFLKDNGIDQPARAGNKIDTLKNTMPDFEYDNVLPFNSTRSHT